MESPRQVRYTATGIIGEDEIIVHAIVDRKNRSIHLHVFGEMFPKKRMPIQVKHSDMELSEGKDVELIKEILTAHFKDHGVHIKRIIKVKDEQELKARVGQPLRIIVRFRGRPAKVG